MNLSICEAKRCSTPKKILAKIFEEYKGIFFGSLQKASGFSSVIGLGGSRARTQQIEKFKKRSVLWFLR
ncbi:hypothetical protein QIA34_05080 (plasmid) [Borreliella yangtzensis]|uniref:Uncharacterized protein n=1 Tax=Borreliella yangtzensis TaxID=683292 RepID=A0ABR6PAZ8_9SPIR|nr:hypothetical protein [Borreliella yangtzensis]